jgi:hypothetical protein
MGAKCKKERKHYQRALLFPISMNERTAENYDDDDDDDVERKQLREPTTTISEKFAVVSFVFFPHLFQKRVK